MAKEKQKLTQRVADAAKPHDVDYFVRDSQIPGFAMKVTAKGSVSWILDYQHKPSGKNKRWKIGDAATMTAKDAREIALKLRNDIAKGGYPVRFRELETVKKICDQYLANGRRHWKTTNPERYLKQFIVPEFGDIPCKDLTAPMVQRWITNRMANGEAASNLRNALAFFKAAWSFAFANGYTAYASPLSVVRIDLDYSAVVKKSDPTKFVPSVDEMARIGSALDELQESDRYNPFGLLAIQMLMYTGGRISEMRDMQVSHIDRTNVGEIDVPRHKTDRRRRLRKYFTITQAARSVIAQALLLRQLNGLHENPYLFPGSQCVGNSRLRQFRRDGAVSKEALTAIWMTIRDKAGVPKMQLRNARSMQASTGASLGLTAEQIASVTKHEDMDVLLKHYITSSKEQEKHFAELISTSIACSMNRRLQTLDSVH